MKELIKILNKKNDFFKKNFIKNKVKMDLVTHEIDPIEDKEFIEIEISVNKIKMYVTMSWEEPNYGYIALSHQRRRRRKTELQRKFNSKENLLNFFDKNFFERKVIGKMLFMEAFGRYFKEKEFLIENVYISYNPNLKKFDIVFDSDTFFIKSIRDFGNGVVYMNFEVSTCQFKKADVEASFFVQFKGKFSDHLKFKTEVIFFNSLNIKYYFDKLIKIWKDNINYLNHIYEKYDLKYNKVKLKRKMI